MTVPSIIIAGTHSGVGKTSIAVGLMVALRRRGLNVVGFKVGPDYIDPGYHRAATGRNSSPLDSWMLDDNWVKQSYAQNTVEADFAIIEGVMGLHDGADADSDAGSTARIAKLLSIPVVLVIDGHALARSAGAMVLGYAKFDPDIKIAGAIANRVSSEKHASYLRPGIENVAGVPFLGFIPQDASFALPERHLGLVGAAESPETRLTIDRLADVVEKQLDLDRLCDIAAAGVVGSAMVGGIVPGKPVRRGPARVRIAVAQDDAFCFYYPDNLLLLEAAGGELVPFSPVSDVSIPDRIDGIYLGGGYPELHVEALSKNSEMRRAVGQFAGEGRPLYAECGGFMYLCEQLVTVDGDTFDMAGVIPGRCIMEKRLQSIGYRAAVTVRSGPLGPAGTTLRGHEFHYSRYEGPEVRDDSAFVVNGAEVGYAHANVVASYLHFHFGSNPSVAQAFVDRCVNHT